MVVPLLDIINHGGDKWRTMRGYTPCDNVRYVTWVIVLVQQVAGLTGAVHELSCSVHMQQVHCCISPS
jgi:hypothetical protein